MRTLKLLFAALAVLATCCSTLVRASDNPLHNSGNSYDVDANGLTQPRDFLLVVNELQRMAPGNASPQLTGGTNYYWDTNNDTHVTPIDALLIANHMSTTATTPEPSTFISAVLGMVFLAGYAWRRRRRQA